MPACDLQLSDVFVGSDICVCAHIGDVSLDGHGGSRICQGLRLSRVRTWTEASQDRQGKNSRVREGKKVSKSMLAP